jgi:hypothetical protein
MRHTLIAVLAVVLMTSSAMAQIEKGDREIQANGYLFAVSGVTMVTMSGMFGYCLTDELQFGGGPTLSIMRYSGDSETTLGLTFFGRFYFNAINKLVPYVNGQLYQYDIAPEEPLGFFDFTYIQGGGGFKYFVNEYIAWDVSGNLGFSLGNGDVSFIVKAGLSAIF